MSRVNKVWGKRREDDGRKISKKRKRRERGRGEESEGIGERKRARKRERERRNEPKNQGEEVSPICF